MSFSFKDHKIAFIFALLSALVVIYQTQRFWLLYDLGYIIEHSYRIALGEIVYKDFFIETTPGTFFIQALLIKIFGFTLIPQIVYCCIVSFITYLLTYRLLFYINNDKWLNLSLVAPLALTGGYGIVSQPFYDIDSMLIILLSLLVLFNCYNKGFPKVLTYIAGFISFIPTFFKQSTGPVFLFILHVILIAAILFKVEKIKFKNYLWFLFGSFSAVFIFLLYIIFICGYKNFILSTITIAYNTRLNPAASNFFHDNYSFIILRRALFWILIIIVLRYIKINMILKNLICFILMLLPLYLAPLINYLFFHSSYFDPFLTVWPVTIIVSLLALLHGLYKFRDESIFYILLFIVLIGHANISFITHGFAISSNGIWPVLPLLFALLFFVLAKSDFFGNRALIRNLFIANSIIIAVSMLFYIKSNSAWYFINGYELKEEVHHSVTPNLKGLALPGDFVTNLDNLVKITNNEILLDDPILVIPHEDPFFFAAGRKVLFPIHITNWTFFVYNVPEIIEKINSYKVRWMIIKTKTQGIPTTGNIENLESILKNEFALYKTIPGYEIYLRKPF